MLIDSHCHLNYISTAKKELDAIIERAQQHQVNTMLCVATDLPRIPEVIHIAEMYTEVFASVGVHPNEEADSLVQVEQLIKLANHEKVVAIGETGLDYYRSKDSCNWQQERFKNHIRAAREINKPLIVHTREARDDTLKILKEEKASEVRGVLHCFTEDWEMASAAIDLGFYISFSGIVTFKNATQIHEVAKKIALENMLVETDSPYLAPVPFRGKPNEPAYVRYVVEFLAELRDEEFATIAKATTRNCRELFAI